ncbi:MAG: spinster family MFS transporter [Gammaproteobacteria bacterium]
MQAYRLLFFLTLLNLLNFIDRQLIASFANFIVPDLGLTDTQYGFLTSLAFILFYSIMGLFMGALADMVNRPRLIAFGVVLWSIFTAISGMAKGFVSMMIPRMFIGVGESILTPTSMSLLSDSFPSSRLGFASGFYYMGVPVGVGISLLIVGYLGEPLGWRNCFYILGAVGFVMGLLMLLFKDRPRKSAALETPTTNETLAFSSILNTLKKALMNSPALVLTIAGGVFYHIVLGAAVFEQLWYAQEKNFDRSSIAQITGIISVVAGISGNLLGGILSDLWQSKTNQGRPMFLFWACLIMLPIFIVFRYSEPNSLIFWVGVTLGYFQLGLFYGPVFSTVQELVPIRIRATIVAFLILMLNLVGLTFGSLGGGVAVDLLRSASVADPYTTMLVIFTAISALNIPCYYFAGKLYERDKKRLEEVFAN